MESFGNISDLFNRPNYELPFLDGTSEPSPPLDQTPPPPDQPAQTEPSEESLSTRATIAEFDNEDESTENSIVTEVVKEVKQPASSQPAEPSSFEPQSLSLARQISQLLSKRSPGKGKTITDIKDNMKAKLYSIILNGQYIEEQINAYMDFEMKKKDAIAKQKQVIGKLRRKKVKKSSVVKKYFYVKDLGPVTKPAWKDEIETSASSVTELRTEVEEPDVSPAGSASKYSAMAEKVQDPRLCEDSDKSISCPSETDSEIACRCSNECTCNEYARFKIFQAKKYEADNKRPEIENPQNRSETEVENRWEDLRHLDNVSQWSEETSLEVTSTSSSSCCIVRKCHCRHCSCGCDEYREYLLYKLYQARSRRRRRNNKRAEKAETLEKIVNENYDEDEYNRTIRAFIDEYYLKEDKTGNKRAKVCSCGLYNCECIGEASDESEEAERNDSVLARTERNSSDVKNELLREVTSSILKLSSDVSRDLSIDDERRKVRFGSDQPVGASNGSQPSQKTVSSGKGNRTSTDDPRVVTEESDDIYKALSRILHKSDSILRFNIDDYIVSDEKRQEKELDLNETSYGSFDHKKYLIANECNCDDYMRYFNFKKKTRRLAEKNDPLLKYFRKRLLYISGLAKAEKLLANTSSETDSPLQVSLTNKCQKYYFGEERRRKIFKKKKRKLEKKAILEIIKKGNHLYPCQCNVSGPRKDDSEYVSSLDICEECKTHAQTMTVEIEKRQKKIEPSIVLKEIREEQCFLGKTETFPECNVCRSSPGRIQFTDVIEENFIVSDRLSDQNADIVEVFKPDSRDNLSEITNQDKMGQSSHKKLSPKHADVGLKQAPKQVAQGTSKKKGRKKKKGKPPKKRILKIYKKGGKPASRKGAKNKNKKVTIKDSTKKKPTNRKEIKVFRYNYFRPTGASENDLDAAVSIFDPEIVFKFGV